MKEEKKINNYIKSTSKADIKVVRAKAVSNPVASGDGGMSTPELIIQPKIAFETPEAMSENEEEKFGGL